MPDIKPYQLEKLMGERHFGSGSGLLAGSGKRNLEGDGQEG